MTPNVWQTARSAACSSLRMSSNSLDETVVAEVRPAVVHVENGDVDDPRVGGRQILRTLDADVFESAAGGIRGPVEAAELMAPGELVTAEKTHGLISDAALMPAS